MTDVTIPVRDLFIFGGGIVTGAAVVIAGLLWLLRDWQVFK